MLVTFENSTKDKGGLYSNELADDILVTKSSRADRYVGGCTNISALWEGIKASFRAKAMSISS